MKQIPNAEWGIGGTGREQLGMVVGMVVVLAVCVPAEDQRGIGQRLYSKVNNIMDEPHGQDQDVKAAS